MLFPISSPFLPCPFLPLLLCFVHFALASYSEAVEAHCLLRSASSSNESKASSSSSKRRSPAPFRRGKTRRGLINSEESIEDRAERYFDGIQTAPDLPGEHYHLQYKAFEKALNEVYDQVQREQPEHIGNSELIKEMYMTKVGKYHHRQMLLKGRERLRRVNKIETSLNEYAALRKEFFNQGDLQGESPQERKRLNALKTYYRKQLKLGNRNILKVMEERGWREEDLKKHVLPRNEEIITFLKEYRAAAALQKRVGRSNPDLSIDLNESLSDGDEEAEEQGEVHRNEYLESQLADMHLNTESHPDTFASGFYHNRDEYASTAYEADYPFET